MKILAIHDGHDCSAALMVDGRIVTATQEERFTGLKTDCGFPRNSIDYCLRSYNISPGDLDRVVLVSKKYIPYKIYLKQHANFKVKYWMKVQRDYWYPRLYCNKEIDFYSLFRDYENEFDLEKYYDYTGILNDESPQTIEKFRKVRISKFAEYLNVKKERVENIDHELAHIYYALFASPFRRERVNVVTCEGYGDYSSATVSYYDPKKDKIIMLAHNEENQLGRVYQFITLLLGMIPAQHEYKVMGLAPYGYDRGRCCDIFRSCFSVKGLNIVRNPGLKDLFFEFRERLLGYRFDDIAAGLQNALELFLCEWFENIYKETKIKRFVFAGGVAQNIKACKALHEKDFVDNIFICPAAGDTSLPLGACYYIAHKNNGDKGIQPLKNIYLGPEYSGSDEIEQALRMYDVENKYYIIRDFTNSDLARWLSEGKIIARLKGRMEFGLRALGNRTIMADPSDYSIVKKLNSKIKFRDFWMPFTPSILDYRADDYIVNPKRLGASFMTVAFDSTELAKEHLIAAIHPMDETVRPQIVKKEENPDYYDLIQKFESITGIGGILNTSFNLHGEPIVLSPERALYTFENSDLDMVQIEDILVSRVESKTDNMPESELYEQKV